MIRNAVGQGNVVLKYGWLLAVIAAIINFYSSLNLPTNVSASRDSISYFSVLILIANVMLLVSLILGFTLFYYRRWVAGLALVLGSIVLSFLSFLIPSLGRVLG